MNPKDFPDTYTGPWAKPATEDVNPHYVDFDAEFEARDRLRRQYFDDSAESSSPLRGVLVCQVCSALVADDWNHIDWHEGTE
jgi:hypothetical protein